MSKDLDNFNVLALDVDGVLTNGMISFEHNNDEEIKSFNVHDGQGISIWQKEGNHVILISGRDSKLVSKRARELNIDHVYQGSKDKIRDLNDALLKIDCSPEQTIFVGDDVGDMNVMQFVGYAIAVHNASEDVRQIADWITPREGGHGAVRDAIEHCMKKTGKWQQAIARLQLENNVQ
tara:strand:+ start:597 stop:1130 length:534 start_codon:yes stop_codon:yes gene_type:complete